MSYLARRKRREDGPRWASDPSYVPTPQEQMEYSCGAGEYVRQFSGKPASHYQFSDELREQAEGLESQLLAMPAPARDDFSFANDLALSQERSRLRKKLAILIEEGNRRLADQALYESQENLDAEGQTRREPLPDEEVGWEEGWQKLRDTIIRRDKFRCQRCREGRFQGLKKSDLSVHHIKPRSEGGSNDPANLITLCHPCHDLVEIHEPPIRNLPQIIGFETEDESRERELRDIRDTVARHDGKRKPKDLFSELALRLWEMGVIESGIANILAVSPRTLKGLLQPK